MNGAGDGERSLLRLRTSGRLQLVEVWRGAEVVATIHGSREGVQILSGRFDFETGANTPFGMDVDGLSSLVVPLLGPDEACPWCGGSRMSLGGECMLCARRK